MICPRCEGEKYSMAFRNPGGYGPVPCLDCHETGEVDDDYPQRRAEGKKLRAWRMEHRISLWSAAQALGMGLAEYSKFEYAGTPGALGLLDQLKAIQEDPATQSDEAAIEEGG